MRTCRWQRRGHCRLRRHQRSREAMRGCGGISLVVPLSSWGTLCLPCLTEQCTAGITQGNFLRGTCQVCIDTPCLWSGCMNLSPLHLEIKDNIWGICFPHMSLSRFSSSKFPPTVNQGILGAISCTQGTATVHLLPIEACKMDHDSLFTTSGLGRNIY